MEREANVGKDGSSNYEVSVSVRSIKRGIYLQNTLGVVQCIDAYWKDSKMLSARVTFEGRLLRMFAMMKVVEGKFEGRSWSSLALKQLKIDDEKAS